MSKAGRRRTSLIRKLFLLLCAFAVVIVIVFIRNARVISMDLHSIPNSGSHVINPADKLAIPVMEVKEEANHKEPTVEPENASASVERASESKVIRRKKLSKELEPILPETGESNAQVEAKDIKDASQEIDRTGNSSSSGSEKEGLRSEENKESVEKENIVPTEPPKATNGCEEKELRQFINMNDYVKLSDFICTKSQEEDIPQRAGPSNNDSLTVRLHEKRMETIDKFAAYQNHFYIDNESKFIVFWPVFAGLGNNLAVFIEVLLIAMMSKRKLLIYGWDALPDYFYTPFLYTLIREKVWERDSSYQIVSKTNECPFSVVKACHGDIESRFLVMRSTCLTTQQIVKLRDDKSWLSQQGILPKVLVSNQELCHHVYHFFYREVLTLKPSLQSMIDSFKADHQWNTSYIIGLHIRTGAVHDEMIRWGRFLNEFDVRLFGEYARHITAQYEQNEPIIVTKRKDKTIEQVKQSLHYPVKWYVISDQDSIKKLVERKYKKYVFTSDCDVIHSNRGFNTRNDKGLICSLLENYLLSDSDLMVLTTRSTFGYLARHRTHAPYISIDVGDYEIWRDKKKGKKATLSISQWNANRM